MLAAVTSPTRLVRKSESRQNIFARHALTVTRKFSFSSRFVTSFAEENEITAPARKPRVIKALAISYPLVSMRFNSLMSLLTSARIFIRYEKRGETRTIRYARLNPRATFQFLFVTMQFSIVTFLFFFFFLLYPVASLRRQEHFRSSEVHRKLIRSSSSFFFIRCYEPRL